MRRDAWPPDAPNPFVHAPEWYGGLFSCYHHGTDMDLEKIESRIATAIPDARVEVTQPRGPEDDDHLAATVVSPAFEGKTLVEQHDMVYDSLDDMLTRDIHAIEVTTRTPAE